MPSHRVHWLNLYKGLSLPQRKSWTLWGRWRTLSLPLAPGPLWAGVIVTVMVKSNVFQQNKLLPVILQITMWLFSKAVSTDVRIFFSNKNLFWRSWSPNTNLGTKNTQYVLNLTLYSKNKTLFKKLTREEVIHVYYRIKKLVMMHITLHTRWHNWLSVKRKEGERGVTIVHSVDTIM